MESKSTSGGVVRRREGALGGSSRYNPYTVVTDQNKYEKLKELVVQLGVELSLCVAESMFLMCDNRNNMLLFCFMICKKPDNPVSERLIHVMHHVYFNEIISKNRLHPETICPRSVHCGLIGHAWEDFDYLIRLMHRLARFLIRNRFSSAHDRLLTMDMAVIKRKFMKKLEDKLRSAKDASEANGFARETLEPTIAETWKSLFKGEAKATKIRLLRELFHPIFGESWQPEWGRPTESSTPRPIYTISNDFAKQEELREEVVRLGVELSLYVTETMFLMCDDIPSVLLFCKRLWVAVGKDLNQPNDSPVMERLLRVFHYVYLKHIKPKNGSGDGGGTSSVQWKLAMACFEDFYVGFRDLHVFVRDGRQEFTSNSIYEALRNIEEKLRCGKAVSKANGYARKAMETEVLVMWKSVFDEPTMGLWALRMMRVGIIIDMFYLPLLKEENSLVLAFNCLNIM
ncbi:hypothetical protein N665_0544s0023 [Sinapis alba]|nr:hypothetical protein N665_0544s0023 [Sinapis alba]KAF8088378.1 hypothetical protein N665_0544s0023 [Sinapis alba]